jgi:hypothetical protein
MKRVRSSLQLASCRALRGVLQGLVVPVLRRADELSFADVEKVRLRPRPSRPYSSCPPKGTSPGTLAAPAPPMHLSVALCGGPSATPHDKPGRSPKP